jgi:hypothetical protein
MLKTTRIKLHDALTLPGLLYGSQNRNIKARNARRITAAEMKCMRKTAGYNWTDYKTDTETAEDLNTTPVLNKIQEYRTNWSRRANRMPRNRLPRITNICRPKGTRNQRRPLRRLLDM